MVDAFSRIVIGRPSFRILTHYTGSLLPVSTCLTSTRFVVVSPQMISSDSSQEEEKEGKAPVQAKRSKHDEAGEGELVYRPVKMSRSDLYRPPTVEELNQLKEAESLFHCSLLKMQVSPPMELREKHQWRHDLSDWNYVLFSWFYHVNNRHSLFVNILCIRWRSCWKRSPWVSTGNSKSVPSSRLSPSCSRQSQIH